MPAVGRPWPSDDNNDDYNNDDNCGDNYDDDNDDDDDDDTDQPKIPANDHLETGRRGEHPPVRSELWRGGQLQPGEGIRGGQSHSHQHQQVRTYSATAYQCANMKGSDSVTSTRSYYAV